MERRQLLALAAIAAALPVAAQQAVQAASPDPLAKLDAAQQRGVKQFFRRGVAGEPQGGMEANHAEIADIDGDGQPDVVLLWTFLGPTYWWSRVTLFQRRGNEWRDTATTEVTGMVEGMSVKGREIHVRTLTAGPNDARCCPSRKTLQRVRWVDGKLR